MVILYGMSKFFFIGDHPMVDFVNTRIISEGERVDLLQDFSDFTEWLQQAGMIDEKEHKALDQRYANNGKSLLQDVRNLRDQLERVVERMSKGQSIPNSAVQRINELLKQKNSYTQLERSDSGFKKNLRLRLERSVHLLAVVAESAADFLCTADPSLVQKCENPKCILYFYDTTKNRRRRWCSMQVCGNRMKASRHYKKTHGK